jgi:hypothetical protein
LEVKTLKISDLLKFMDEVSTSVATLFSGLDEKFANAYSSLRNEVKDIRAELSSSASSKSVEELRAAINLSTEDLRNEIETRVSLAPTEIKAVSCEGKSLTISLSDGREETFELSVIEGKDGKDGADGKDGVGIKSIEAKSGSFTLISTAGEEYTVELPKPEAPLLPAAPRDPTDISDAMVDRNGELTLVFSNGTTKNVGKIVGRDGIDGLPGLTGDRGPAGLDGVNGINGIDGRDGFGFDDMTAELLGDGRTVNFKFVRGDDVKEFTMKFPVMIFRNAYMADVVYTQGDVVAFGGGTFHANSEVIGVVPGTSDAWTQQTAPGRSVRGERGIAGKDGRNGIDGKDFR